MVEIAFSMKSRNKSHLLLALSAETEHGVGKEDIARPWDQVVYNVHLVLTLCLPLHAINSCEFNSKFNSKVPVTMLRPSLMV